MPFANENRGRRLSELLLTGGHFLLERPARLYAILVFLVLISFLIGAWYAGSSASSTGASGDKRQILYYVDPMNPAHTSPEPGLAPCGMKMEPVFADEEGQTPPGALLPGTVKITPQKQQLIGVKLTQVEKAPFTHQLRVLGKVVSDETLLYRLNAAVDGWIIKTFDRGTGSVVKKNEVIATYYSQDFLAAQQAYISALNQMDRYQAASPGTHDQFPLIRLNVHRSFDTLEILGMSQLQIKEITRTRQYSENILMVAPATSFILARNLSPGQRFQKGTEWYQLADLSRVWIMADLYEHEAQYVKPGAEVKVNYPYQQKTLTAKVSEILPAFDPATRTLKVRLVVDNPDYLLRPDMFVDATFSIQMPPTITVSSDALMDSGLKKTVFVDRGNGFFEPRKVETGWRLGDRVEITRGLSPGERIVVSGNFLIDSESRMKLAASGMLGEVNQDPVCGRNLDETKSRAAGLVTEIDGKTYYFCSPQCQKTFGMVPERYTVKPDEGLATTAKAEPPLANPAEEAKTSVSESCCPQPGAAQVAQETDTSKDGAKVGQKPDPQKELLPETGASRQEATPHPGEGTAVAASPEGAAKDPVCGRSVDVAQSREAGWKSEYKGKTYYFCRDFCKTYFDRKPEFYSGGADIGHTQGLPHPYHHLLGKPDYTDYFSQPGLTRQPQNAPGSSRDQGAAGTRDPVCGKAVGERFAGALDLTSEFQGKTYFFCSPKCKQVFDQNPQQQLHKAASAPGREPAQDSHQAHNMPGGQMAGPAATPPPVATPTPEGSSERSPGGEAPQHQQSQAMPEHQSHGAQGQGSAPASPKEPMGQASSKDPVCGMQVDPAKARQAGFYSSHQGEDYYFCSDKCKTQFNANPDGFLTAPIVALPPPGHKPPEPPGGKQRHD